MTNVFQKQAQEWFERGKHDFESAQLLYDEEGYTDSIAYHIQQAIEKYLKGFLVLNGKNPPKTHELDTLLNHAIPFNKSLAEFLGLCEKASRYYIENRYPPGPLIQHERSEMKSDLESAEELINRILGHLGK